MHLRVPLALWALALVGCATDNPSGVAPILSAVERGRAVAEQRCEVCHAIGASGESPNGQAPTFQRLRVRYNQISWERVMNDIAAGAHDEMPALSLDTFDRQDVRAYIESLR